jgi:hypothetical protein
LEALNERQLLADCVEKLSSGIDREILIVKDTIDRNK